MTKKLLFISAVIVIFSSCKKIYPDPSIPSYIYLNAFDYQANTLVDTSASKSSSIENVWVYADNELIGAFVLPAKVPILKKGKVFLSIRPGVKQNGITNTRIAYPFYTPYADSTMLYVDSVLRLNLTTQYFDYTNLAFNEYFEKNTVNFEQYTIGKGVNMKRTSVLSKDYFEGADSGEILLSGKDSLFDIQSSKSFTLPIGGREVYLEMNFKSPIAFDFGLVANAFTGKTKSVIYTFNPSYDDAGTLVWKKIYIDMASVITQNSTATDFRIYFYGVQSSTAADARILFDNIKVAHVNQ
jgi:hypothetical protein